ncbi:hypothetical protein FACS189476_02780 [Spirochaetia bacterium]|nr:hypothetical protein FACS189476_02780 [Spirochaetia bacterium]
MENPWKSLNKNNGEYIANCDKNDINSFYRYSLIGDYSLQLKCMPGPYMGNPQKAAVFILALNPGHSGIEDIKFTNENEELMLNNLQHKIENYPFFLLNQKFKGTGGYEWWYKKSKYFINELGIEWFSKLMCNVEYFPYCSKKYKNINKILPSQYYTFSLIRDAIKNKKIIIIMRGKTYWYKAIPELENYKDVYFLHSTQNVILSPNNLGINEYNTIKEHLLKCKNYGT